MGADIIQLWLDKYCRDCSERSLTREEAVRAIGEMEFILKREIEDFQLGR